MIISRRMMAIALLMVAGAGLALAITPTKKIADTREKTDLNAMIPQQIGEWNIDSSIVPIEPSPEVKALLNKIYNQTLARTYVNRAGQRIMLSIAYGGDQSDSMRVHFPEVCYAAQGFEVTAITPGMLVTRYGALPIKRLVAFQGKRDEPITYWVTVGDKAVSSAISQKLAQLSYGLTGNVPDGFLVRVSSIDSDPAHAYRIQEEFMKSMLDTMNEKNRVRLAGRLGA